MRFPFELKLQLNICFNAAAAVVSLVQGHHTV